MPEPGLDLNRPPGRRGAWNRPHPVGPQRHDGADPAGAAGRQPGCDEGRGTEDQWHADERQRVERVDLERQPAQQAVLAVGSSRSLPDSHADPLAQPTQGTAESRTRRPRQSASSNSLHCVVVFWQVVRNSTRTWK